MHAAFVDANPALRAIAERLGPTLPGLTLSFGHPASSRGAARGARRRRIAVIDHTAFPIEIARRCDGVTDVVFLGTGARSYMDPEALGSDRHRRPRHQGLRRHRGRRMRDRPALRRARAASPRWIAACAPAQWLRTEGTQLGGKTLGLVGFGGIAAETARMARGIGMKVLAWNRTPKSHPGVEFVPIERLLAESDAVSLHLLLNDETRGFLSRERIAAMRPGALLVNTARGALVDEAAMIDALASGRLGHAALDVFEVEPLPAGHVLTTIPNVTLSAHSGFRTPRGQRAADRGGVRALPAHRRRRAAAPGAGLEVVLHARGEHLAAPCVGLAEEIRRLPLHLARPGRHRTEQRRAGAMRLLVLRQPVVPRPELAEALRAEVQPAVPAVPHLPLIAELGRPRKATRSRAGRRR
jgi:D-3-phosphoglycerate dehydrogenase